MLPAPFCLPHVQECACMTYAGIKEACFNLFGIICTFTWILNVFHALVCGPMPWGWITYLSYLTVFGASLIGGKSLCHRFLCFLLILSVTILFVWKESSQCVIFDVTSVSFLFSGLFEKESSAGILLVPQLVGAVYMCQQHFRWDACLFFGMQIIMMYLLLATTFSKKNSPQQIATLCITMFPLFILLKMVVLPLLYADFRSQWNCPICLKSGKEIPEMGEKVIRKNGVPAIDMLLCGHALHTSCRKQLLKNSFTKCPSCQKPLRTSDFASVCLDL